MARKSNIRHKPGAQPARKKDSAVDRSIEKPDSTAEPQPPEMRPATRRPKLVATLIGLFVLWIGALVYLAIRVNT